MRHFSMEQWIDFARNTVGPRERAEMQSHLSDGCTQCSKMLSLWQRVAVAGKRESAYVPPASVVGAIKGTFAIRGPRRVARAARAMASLVFDSARTPLVAGVRSAATADRQLLYGVSKYRVDVRIEPQPNSGKVALVGQVLNSKAPGESLGVVPVQLCRGHKVIMETLTSPFGEFDVQCDLGKGLELRVMLPNEELCLPVVEPSIARSMGILESADSKRFSGKAAKHRKGTRKKV
jgi:hypothetical protein